MNYKTFLLLLLFLFISHAQLKAQVIIINDSSEIKKTILDKGWKFHAGDNSLWADTSFDDTSWIPINSQIEVNDTTEKFFKDIGWFRLWVVVDSSVKKRNLNFLVTQRGASEIFIDGEKVTQYGLPSADHEKEFRIRSERTPFNHTFSDNRKHLIAIRYSNTNWLVLVEKYYFQKAGFAISLANIDEINYQNQMWTMLSLGTLSVGIFFITLGFVHFLLFLFYRVQKTNFFYSLFALLFGANFILKAFAIVAYDLELCENLNFYYSISIPFILLALNVLVNLLFGYSWKRTFKISIVALPIIFYFYFFHYRNWNFLEFNLIVALTISSLTRVFIAVIKKQPGAWIIGIGMLIFLCTFMFMLIRVMVDHPLVEVNINSESSITILILEILACMAVPVSMSIYLAREFAFTNKNLSKKLTEVEELSARTIAQEQEKKNILESQKEKLEQQVAERTLEISYQKNLVEIKNKDITDSINYAKRIQSAILPDIKTIQQTFRQSFILYLPKDIVSGDFYLFAQKNDRVLVAAADCTGHGVSGAFMSMIGSSLLNQIINEKGITEPAKILDQLNSDIIQSLKQKESESNDGMDISICSFDLKNNDLQFAGANRPLYLIRNNELTVYLPDKFPIGGLQILNDESFTNHTIKLLANDTIYIFSDGYADQFGGEKVKKMMTKKFKEIVLSIQHLNMSEQEKYLKEFFEKWKHNHEQVDDVLVIGIKV